MKKYGSGLFLNPKNTEEGDVIIFTEEGVEGDYEGKANVTFDVELDEDIKKITLNPTSVQNLSEVWGWDSKNWISKSAEITFVEKPIQGKLQKYIVLVPVKDNVGGNSDIDKSDIPVFEGEEEEPKKKVE